MWLCVFLLIVVAFDLSALVRYITRFTEESFAMLIAIIFIYEAFKKQFESAKHHPINLHPDQPLDYNCTCDLSKLNLTEEDRLDSEMYFNQMKSNWSLTDRKIQCNGTLSVGCFTPRYVPDVFFFSCLIFIGTFALSYALKMFRNTRFFPNRVRVLVSDFAVFTAICLMVFTDFMVGLGTDKLLVPEKFEPTKATHRGWIVNPFGSNPWWCFFAGFPPALLATILIFMDQQITSVIINRKEHKLRKGCGYHLDLLLITIQIGCCTLLGTPWFVAATVLSINHVRALTRETESSAPGERPKFLGIREQRVTGTLVFIMVGLSAFLASVLKHIPMSVLYGVFLFMGISSLKGIQFVQRVLMIFMPAKYQPDYMFLRNVPVRKVHLFTFIQILCLSGLCVIKEIESISIIFPLMVLAMCFIRKSLDYVFTRHELKWLDDIMPESHKREKEEKKKKLLESAAEQLAEEVAAIAVPEASAQIKLAIFSPSGGAVGGESSTDAQLRHRKSAADSGRDVEKAFVKSETKVQQPVRFKIADDDEDDKPESSTLLDKPPPYILIESPSANRISSGEATSPAHV
jgi:anion exchange protein